MYYRKHYMMGISVLSQNAFISNVRTQSLHLYVDLGSLENHKYIEFKMPVPQQKIREGGSKHSAAIH